MAQQLGLNLPGRTAHGRDDFFVAPSNRMALALIEGWRGWANGKMVLTGPDGAGKTHLAHVWAEMSGARIVAATSLASADVPSLASAPLAVEDVPDIADDTAAQTALFHLHNLLLAEGHALLLTGAGTAAQWPMTLPDLMSRIQGTTSIALEPPDDALLSAVLVKLLADRQLTPKPDLIPYLRSRMDRSFSAAMEIIDRLDTASIALKRPVTRHLAAQVLDKPRPDT
jgi:chromosomal replication initiation ATPase DnaA